MFTPVSSTNKTDRHDVTEILLKVVLITTTLTPVISTIWKIMLRVEQTPAVHTTI
jgi:hypothetical protein